MRTVYTCLIISLTVLLVSPGCDRNDNNDPVLENKTRIECERRASACNGKDAMRFYQSMPLIQQKPNGEITVTEVWNSFLVCCEDFTRIMVTLTSFNRIFDSIPPFGVSVYKSDTIGRIIISASYSLLDEWSDKRMEWLNFGDSTMTWLVPTGSFFDAHKRALEEAHARCCLL